MLTAKATQTAKEIGTDDTFDHRQLTWKTDEAIERALNSGYDCTLDPEPPYVVAARNADDRLRAELYDLGKVDTWWQDGCLRMRFRDRETYFRGSSIEGCDYTDEFVRHLARQFRDQTHAH